MLFARIASVLTTLGSLHVPLPPATSPAGAPPAVATAHSARIPAAAPSGRSASTLTLGGTPCRLVGVPSLPVGVLEQCPGIRPGAAVVSPTGLCTLNFMFSGSDGATYMGTAGHCILEGAAVNEAAWPRGRGPEADDATGKRMGEFAFAVLREPLDFALVRLDPGVESSPQICHFGGPTGIDTDITPLPQVLEQFGQGEIVGDTVPARPEVALGLPAADHVFAAGVVLPGDSGSPVIAADGRAVGVVVTVGISAGSVGVDGVDAGTVGIVRLAPQIAEAHSATGITYTLQTAPLAGLPGITTGPGPVPGVVSAVGDLLPLP